MKKWCGFAIFLFTLFSAVSIFGQTDSGVTIVKFEWKPEDVPRSLASQTDPLAPVGGDDYSTVDKKNPAATLIKNPDGSHSINPDSARVSPTGSPEPARINTVASTRQIKAVIEIKNDSAKEIAEFETVYVLFDKDKKEYFRYAIVSDKNVKPGKSAKVKKILTTKDIPATAPVGTIFGVVPVDTKVEVVRVKYSDGTVWTSK